MTYRKRKRAWQARRPEVTNFLRPIYKEGKIVAYSSISGTWTDYMSAMMAWLADEPKRFPLLRKDRKS